MIAIKKKKLIIMGFVATLVCTSGCIINKQYDLTVRDGNLVTYQCENGDRIAAKYYSLSDDSLNFVKIKMPDGREYTLPQALSASGARYTNDLELVWWIKGDSAMVETRGPNEDRQLKYANCRVVPANK